MRSWLLGGLLLVWTALTPHPTGANFSGTPQPEHAMKSLHIYPDATYQVVWHRLSAKIIYTNEPPTSCALVPVTKDCRPCQNFCPVQLTCPHEINQSLCFPSGNDGIIHCSYGSPRKTAGTRINYWKFEIEFGNWWPEYALPDDTFYLDHTTTRHDRWDDWEPKGDDLLPTSLELRIEMGLVSKPHCGTRTDNWESENKDRSYSNPGVYAHVPNIVNQAFLGRN